MMLYYSFIQLALVGVSLLSPTSAFLVGVAAPRGASVISTPSFVAKATNTAGTVDSETLDNQIAPNGLFKRDCYIATNRFAVRPNQQAVFEKRWATRKSRLAVLPGFRYFHLMRRINKLDGSYDGGDGSNEAAQENYVSFTIWDKKSDFSAWRKGDAFKEAHGGTSIVSFLSTMVNSALVLRGAPKPAFYDGLFLNYEKPSYLPDPVDGWRSVQANGVDTLPAECFVEMTKYFVPTKDAQAFETKWKESDMNPKADGFIARSLMRRDGQAKGHGVTPLDPTEPTYVAVQIFESKSKFDEMQKTAVASVNIAGEKAPEMVYYEGTLMLASPN